MDDILSHIAQREDGIFNERGIKKATGSGTYMPFSYYELTFDYKGYQILLHNELGQTNTGNITVTFSNRSLEEFTITNRSHFWRLFNKGSNILKIKTVDSTLAIRLEDLLEKSMLEHYSRENLFEPKIYNLMHDNTMRLITEYHLEFDDKKNITEALISFYKLFIDALIARKI